MLGKIFWVEREGISLDMPFVGPTILSIYLISNISMSGVQVIDLNSWCSPPEKV